MSLNGVKPNKAISKIESFIEEIESLEGLSHQEGKEKLQKLDEDIKKFVKVTFSNSDEKLKGLSRVTMEIVGRKKSDEEKQEDYDARLAHKREYLEDLKEEVELIKELREDASSQISSAVNKASTDIDNSNISAGRDVVINNEAEQNSKVESYEGDKKNVFFIEKYSKFLDNNFEDATVGAVAGVNFLASLLSIVGSINGLFGVQFPTLTASFIGVSTAIFGGSLVAALVFKHQRSCSECSAKFSMEEYKDPEVRKKELEDKYKYRVKRFLKCAECGETKNLIEKESRSKDPEN